jgi:hypothetical protein
MRLANLDNVERFLSTLPYYELKDIYIDGVKSENYKAVVYKGTSKAVAVVSNRYKLVQHKTVFDIVLEKIKENLAKENVKGWVEHTKTKAYLFLTFKDIEIQNDSNYNCGLLVTNSVNTQLSIWTNLFLYRVICSNGLVQKENILAIQNKHLGSSEFWDRFKSRVETVIQNYDNYLTTEFNLLEEFKTITLNPSEILSKLEISKKALFVITKQLKPTDTLFNVYQAITNYYTNTQSMNIASRVQYIRKARELINLYAKSVLERG